MHHRYYLSIFIVVVGFCPISVKAQISTPPGWSFVRNLESEVTHVYAYGDTVLALEGNIFLRTVDGGENWDSVVIPSSNWILEVSPIVPVLVIFRSAVRDSIHSDYFISTSHDLGNSFQTFKLDTSISNLMYCCDISLVLSPYNEKMLYLTYTSDAGTLLFSSSNEGQDWKKIYYPKEAPEILINQIFDARIISRWYLDIIEKSGEMRVLRGVYRTDDNGESFVKDSLWYIDYASIGYSGEFRISIDEGFRVFNSDTAINSYWDDDWYFRVMKTNDAYAEDGDRLSRMIAFDFAWNSPNTSIATFQDDSVKDVANRQHYRRVLAQTFDNGKNFNILWDDSISSLDAYLD
ncbi:MAG TPA: hypothetical protein VG537_06075, partial [Candidatus Kapabacteria bacterium]|nr:hypothetical protein [Candidatus Kapabacteria bacterium]